MYIDINDSLPGWNHIETLITLGELASEVPNGGWIIETGSLAGRGSYPLASNKMQDTILTCIDLFPDAPTKPDPEAFGHVDLHVNYFSFKKNIVEQFPNVESLNADLPFEAKNLQFSKPIDMIYFNNAFDPLVWEVQMRSIMPHLAPDCKIVVHNVHLMEEMIHHIFNDDDYELVFKNLLCIITKKDKVSNS